MAWGAPDLQNLWWFKPEPAPDFLPAVVAGAQIAHQQRMDRIQAADELYKQQVREQMGAGTVELAKALADGFRSGDITSPESQSKILGVAEKYPYLVGTTAWNGIDQMIRNGESIKLRRLQQENLTAYRMSLAESSAKRAEASMKRAESYGASVEDRAEYNRINLELRTLLANSRVSLDDERIRDLQEKRDYLERRMQIAEGNLELRKQEAETSLKRLESRLPATVRERVQAAREKLKMFGYSTDFAENTKGYVEELDKLLEPFETQPSANVPDEDLYFDPKTGKATKATPVK